MYGLSSRPSNPNVAALASALLERLQQFADDATDRICQQVEAYRREQPVPRADLNSSCRQNLEFGFRSLVDAGPYDLSAPRRTGRLRAAQGAPLAMVHSAYRTGFAYMWECVVAEAERSGLVSATELVRIASDVWTLNEMFTTEMATSYRDAMTDQILRQDQERSALVEALVSGSVADTATVWGAADLLVLPVVTTRVGVSPVYEGLEKTAQAMHLARIAMASITPGDPQLCVFDDAP